MPWLSIIVWLVTFLLSGGTESGKAGKSALLATGAALGSYYLVDPANPDAMFDWFSSSESTAAVSGVSTANTTGIGSTAVTTAGDVLKSWGPTGTAGVIATGAAASSGIFDEPWLWALGALAALIILK